MTTRRLLAAVAAATLSSVGTPHSGWANPAGGSVVSGSAAIAASGKNLTINQSSNRAILNWQRFSIGNGETTRIVQPSAASAILNRVTGGDPSVLLGRLQSNGQVYLINPNGIVVGPNGMVDTRGFIASTLDVPNAAFQRGGSLTFSGGSTATITNLGTIKTTGGDVALIALHVVNGGSILAPDGQAILAGGSQVLYVPDGQSEVVIQPTQAPGGASVDNSGRVAAASAQLKAAGSPYALAVNNSGQINATGVSRVGGRVVLDGGAGDVETGGTIAAPGGSATLRGGRVAVTGNIDVSAPAGGGSIAVQATNAAVATPGATLNANATQQGNGGTIRIKSSGATTVAGAATATGGPLGGNGGSAEISGATLGFSGSANLTAPKGTTGSLLFDPDTIIIASTGSTLPNLTGGVWTFTTQPGTQTVSAAEIDSLLNSASLTLQATTSIAVNAAISGARAGSSLTLDSPTIAVNAGIANAGALIFANTGGNQGLSLTSVPGATLTASGVQVVGNYGTTTLAGQIVAGALTLNPATAGMGSFTANNAANQISTFQIGGGQNPIVISGDLSVASGTPLSVNGPGELASSSASGNITVVAAGNLAIGPQLTFLAPGTLTLASTGGVFTNNSGPQIGLVGTGRTLIYAASDLNGYAAIEGAATGFTAYNPVAFGSDPEPGQNQVIYIAHSTVLPALTVSADDQSRQYGLSGPIFTFHGGLTSSASLAIQPQFSLLQGSTPINNSIVIAAGGYTIVPSGAISSTNAINYSDGAFTVSPAPLTITANAQSRAYGAANPTFTSAITSGSLLNGDMLSGSLATTATTASNVGSYPITQGTLSAGSNYTLTYDGANLGITAAPLTVTADTQTRTYGASNPALTVAVTSGTLFNGDTLSGAQTTTATTASSVGAYPITQGTLAATPNYTLTYDGANLNVTAAPLTVTANTQSRTYGALNPALAFAITSGSLFNGDTLSGALTTAATTASNIGAYPITQGTLAATSNYTLTYDPANLAVIAAPLTVTANPQTRTYGAANPALTFAITSGSLFNGDNLSGAPTTAASAASNAGTYPITQGTLAATSNYTLTYDGANLAVTPAALTLTANAQTKTYGASNPAFTFAITSGGLLNGDTLSGAQTTTATTASSVGSYPITQGTLSAGSNYTLTYDGANLAVTPAALTITANASKVYGAALPTLPAGDFAGFVNGDTAASLTTQPTLTTSATAASNVGSYALSASGAAAANYTISYIAGNLSVTPASLTITANATKVYGAPVSSATLLAGDFVGFVNGDTVSSLTTQPTIHTLATASSPVGSTALTNATGAADPNYTITVNLGTMTVTPAPLLITAGNASQTYGSPNVTFGANYTGLVNGDGSSVVSGLTIGTSAVTAASIGTPAHIISGVGTYSLIPFGASASNYSISYADGTLTITPAALIATANNVSRAYGSGNPAFAASLSGLANGDSPSIASGLQFQTAATSGSGVGNYTINVSGGTAGPNYQLFYLPGSLTVNPAPLQIVALDAARLFGQDNPIFTGTVSGLANGDGLSVITGLTFNTLAGPGAKIGNYAIVASQATAKAGPNYTLSFTDGTLTIEPAPLTIIANDAGIAANDPMPSFTGTFTGLVAGNTQVSTGYGFATTTSTTGIPGRFPINLTGSDPNYTVTFMPGTLLIAPSEMLLAVEMAHLTTLTLPTTPQPTVMPTDLTLAPLPVLNVNDPGEVITVRSAKDPAFLFGPISDSIVAVFAASTGTTADTIYGNLANPSTSAAQMALVLPFFYAELSAILNAPQSNWTYDQSLFVQNILTFINQQRRDAAIQAQNDYNAWYQQQNAKQQALLAGLTGPAYVEMSQILASNPPVPPQFLLQEAQLGMYMTASQGVTYAGIQGATTALANGLSHPDGFIAGAVSDVGSIAKQSAIVAGLINGEVQGSIYKTAVNMALETTTVGQDIDLSAIGYGFTRAVRTTNMSETAINMVDASTESVMAASDAARIVGAAGLAFQLAGNAVQAAVGIYEYAELGSFNSAFNGALNADNTPLTVSGLKAMINGSNSTQVYGYLTNMLAGGNSPAPLLVDPSTPQSVYESL